MDSFVSRLLEQVSDDDLAAAGELDREKFIKDVSITVYVGENRLSSQAVTNGGNDMVSTLRRLGYCEYSHRR